MSRNLVVEAVGTFFFILTIGMVVLEPGAAGFAPLAIGSALMVMVYAGGHISGGHYNPAVTLGVMLRGKASATDLVGYWVAQIVGAVAAGLAVRFLKGGGAPAALVLDVPAALLAEFLFTFALVYVVLSVATARGTKGNSYYGLAIGFTVMIGAFAVGGISGGAFNPAVATGLLVLGIANAGNLAIYVIANLAGGAAAALLFNALDLGDDKPTTATAAEQRGLEPAASTRA
jgi:aquaporin Z